MMEDKTPLLSPISQLSTKDNYRMIHKLKIAQDTRRDYNEKYAGGQRFVK